MPLARYGGLLMVAAMLVAGMPTLPARGDTPATAVHTQPIAPGGTYPGVDAHSEGWFDVGGFCKVVDVGDLSTISPTAEGVPVFIPGPASQWENYRTTAPSRYNGQLVLTTCCRPAPTVSTICASATNPQSVGRQYGKLGEADTVSATCIEANGSTYVETQTLTCEGSTGTLSVDNGPDGQASWSETSDAGVPPKPQCPATYIAWGNTAWNSTSSGDHSAETQNGETVACGGLTPSGTVGQTITIASTSTLYLGVSPQLTCAMQNGTPQWLTANEISTGGPSYQYAYQNDLGPIGDIAMGRPFNAYAHGNGNGDTTLFLNTEVDGGTCVQPICTAGTLTWTANGNTCSQDLPNQQSTNGGTGLDRGLGAGPYSPPDTYTYYGNPGNTYEAAEQGSATTLGGHAYFVCGSNGTWQVQPGATCGVGMCEHFTPGGSTGPCVLGSEAQYDECGNYVSSFNCGGGPPPPSCTPSSVANGTVNADCSITCNSGYTLNGSTCQSSGSSSGQCATGPTPSCPTPGTPVAGSYACEPTNLVYGDVQCPAQNPPIQNDVTHCSSGDVYCSAIFSTGLSADNCSCTYAVFPSGDGSTENNGSPPGYLRAYYCCEGGSCAGPPCT